MISRIVAVTLALAWIGITAFIFGTAITRPWDGHAWFPGSLFIGGLGVVLTVIGGAIMWELVGDSRRENAGRPKLTAAERRAERIKRLERELGIDDRNDWPRA